jgi:hypothetical protein
MNPLNAPLYDLFLHLNTLNGLLLNINDQLNSFEKSYRQSISETSFGISSIYSGSSIAIRDLTEWPENSVAKYYSCGAPFSVKGEEYFELIKILIAREASWTISQAYEAFETFLKNTLILLLLENPELAEIKKIEKFKLDKKRGDLKESDFSFWEEYLKYYYKTNSLKLKFLRKICPAIYKSETENNRTIDLNNWFAVVEEVRHSATHSNFIVKNNRMGHWTRAKNEMLKNHFHGRELWYGYILNTTIEDAKFSLILFSEYSFQIYKFLLISRGYDWNILQKKSEQ